jgi:hypothetical protein
MFPPFSGKMPQLAIGVGVTSTLAYLLYREALSAILIDMTPGGIGMGHGLRAAHVGIQWRWPGI